MPKVVQTFTAHALKSALESQAALFTRSIWVNHLLGTGSGLFARKDLVDGAKRGASAELNACVDELVASQSALSVLFAAEQEKVEQTVDELTLRLLTELGFSPRRSRYAHRRPAWVCTLPRHSWGKQEVAILGVSTVSVDKKGEVSSLHLRVSEYDNGSSDSWTLERRSGRLAVSEHVDY